MTGAYDLIDRIGRGRRLIVRDDQNTFEELLDAARASRERKERFGVLDTGKLGVSELEWIAEAGADIFTSDEARPNVLELALIARACARGGGAVALLVNGGLEDRHADLARDGIILHVSNRERAIDYLALAELAAGRPVRRRIPGLLPSWGARPGARRARPPRAAIFTFPTRPSKRRTWTS